MSSDLELGKSAECLRPVLRKTQPKVPPKIPVRLPIKPPALQPKTISKQSSESLPKPPKICKDLSPQTSPKQLQCPSSPSLPKTPPSTPKPPMGAPTLTSSEAAKRSAKCLTKKPAASPPSTPVPSSPGSLAAAMKSSKQEFHAQRRLRIAGYGRKEGSNKSGRVVPEGPDSFPIPPPISKKRCGWITSQSAYIAYHDHEWGVPVHDDILLFELLVLVGAQAELSWPTILSKREHFRRAFADFDPVVVASFTEKKIASLGVDSTLSQPESKIRGAVNNANRILETVREWGSFSNYLWTFVNHKPIINKCHFPKQVPVKTPKSEVISKDLVKRGFRSVGPTVVYSFMQATGMANDHLVQCFRYSDCLELSEQRRSEKGGP
ncbi:hypothetical protein O6H91_14G070800 [Diphasiastrum complanatum]|uniref:Uncharacterized protein n=1 Tax=Diphasiastrum complanatum TaxID=34168 RepID=A0ACC2BQP0_DIPCM|nr:hypothetical protein O6H91_14G070800 [Diphasiastrum complanatum]